MKINHITYTVSDIQEAVLFYNRLFRKSPVAVGIKLAYYDLDGLWFALNLEEDNQVSYQHIAFDCHDLEALKMYLDDVNIEYELGRPRHQSEKSSVYIRDPFQNLIEFHSGSLSERLAYYKQREDIEVR